jgi:hypothetical protein
MNTDDPPLRRVRQLRGYGALAVAAAAFKLKQLEQINDSDA